MTDQLFDLILVLALIGLGALVVITVSMLADPARPSSSDDPFFFPIGEAPTVHPDAIGNYRRHMSARDFRPGAAE